MSTAGERDESREPAESLDPTSTDQFEQFEHDEKVDQVDHGPVAPRWMSAPFLLLVRFYQLVISPITPPSCRFYPSCSAYTFTAIERFGPVRGIWLGLRRLLRCHPWNPGGVDHVPARGPRGQVIRQNEVDADPPATGEAH